MTTCAYCRREYSQPPAECVGCGAPVPQASATWGDALLQANDPWYDAFNAARQANFNYDGWVFDGYPNYYYYGEEPTR